MTVVFDNSCCACEFCPFISWRPRYGSTNLYLHMMAAAAPANRLAFLAVAALLLVITLAQHVCMQATGSQPVATSSRL